MEAIKKRRENRKKTKDDQANRTEDAVFQALMVDKRLEMDEVTSYKTNFVKDAKIQVCVRKRPIFDREIEAGAFDCITCKNPRIFVHECKTKIDGIHRYIDDQEFYFDNVFNDDATSDEIFYTSLEPVVPTLFENEIVTVFAYGQTGSGKTFTMNNLQNKAIDYLFDFRNKKLKIKQPHKSRNFRELLRNI